MREYVVTMMKNKDYNKYMAGYNNAVWKTMRIVVNAIDINDAKIVANKINKGWTAIEAKEYNN